MCRAKSRWCVGMLVGSCLLAIGGSLAAADQPAGRVFHVSVHGDDANDGSPTKKLRTISAAADRAQPGDVITVHEGIYRERIDPPRGGESDRRRIIYQAAPGERVRIKGSEVVKGWKKLGNDTWQVTLPNSFFGDLNPYSDEIRGDWFNPRGRKHHSGAVYLDGHWLIEAACKEDVLQPFDNAASYRQAGGQTLLNVAWLRVGKDAAKIPADRFADEHGVKTADCTEGGKCIGWLEHGDWVCYEGIDFGDGSGAIEVRVASANSGGAIEFRLGSSDGRLLGRQAVPNTGGWQSWVTRRLEVPPLAGKQVLCLLFKSSEAHPDPASTGLWFATVDARNTTILAQFPNADPNQGNVEINVRQAVFYPSRPGRDFITVRGFTLEQAATNWAPPTAEQIGLIGTHWSQGWVIEDNTIRYSVCTGVTLGKHGDEFDNTSQDTATGYVETIKRGLAAGWSKENIGHHVVRNNHISHCEQAGIVGSLGPAFSTVTGNVIHDIHVRQLFTGAEMAGIKFHGAIDTVIRGNHIYRASRGIWLDWMTQGTRVTRNLVHDIAPREDLFVEVNHGPFLVDHNIFLSAISLLDVSEGGAYAHNLFAGRITSHPELNRETPWQMEHGTRIAGLARTEGGDNCFFNNVFLAPAGLDGYDNSTRPNRMAGNVFFNAARPSKHEQAPMVADFDPGIRLTSKDGSWLLQIVVRSWNGTPASALVTTELLGKAAVSGQAYVRPDGSPYRLDKDYFGSSRNPGNPLPGPFAGRWKDDAQLLRVWPVELVQP